MRQPRPLRSLLATALLAATAACTGTPREDLRPGEVPSSNSVEAGLWMQAEQAETKLRTSGRLVPDPELQAYVQDLACRLAGDHCAGLRVYVVRQPHFNAFMLPNGTMAVWSGLLLRCENEDQLATVVGHEIAHYLRRHSVQRWEALRDSLGAAQLFGVATAMVGVPVGPLITLGAYGHVMSYSRDQEREADSLGFALLDEHGYDSTQAAAIWRNLIAEREAADSDDPDPFFASHPPSQERMETLEELAAGSDAPPAHDSARLHAVVAPHLAAWLEDEIDLGRFKQVQVVLARMKDSGRSPGVVWYYLGEVLRRDAEVEDKTEALAALRKALDYADAPAVTHRSLGLLLAREGDTDGAREAYGNYLAAAPDAGDAAMIRYYMQNLETKP